MLSQFFPGGQQALRKLVYGRARLPLLVLRVLIKIRIDPYNGTERTHSDVNQEAPPPPPLFKKRMKNR